MYQNCKAQLMTLNIFKGYYFPIADMAIYVNALKRVSTKLGHDNATLFVTLIIPIHIKLSSPPENLLRRQPAVPIC